MSSISMTATIAAMNDGHLALTAERQDNGTTGGSVLLTGDGQQFEGAPTILTVTPSLISVTAMGNFGKKSARLDLNLFPNKTHLLFVVAEGDDAQGWTHVWESPGQEEFVSTDLVVVP